MHIITDAQSYAARPKDAESGRKEKVSKSAGQSGKTAVKSYFAQNMTSSKCLVVGCDKSAAHALWDCPKFGTLSHRDKWAIAKKQGCCYKCLNNGHHQADCKSRYCCRICKNAQHHYLLCPNENATQEQVNAHYHNVLFDESRKLLPIVSVQAINPETRKSSMINCLIDSGCDTTMATKNLAKLLDLKQKSITEVNLATTNAKSCETAFKVDLIIKNCRNDEEFCLDSVICVDKVAVRANRSNTEIVHIAGLDEIPTIDLPKPRHQTVDIIIGTDNEYLHDVSEIRRTTECNIAAKFC